MKKLIIALTIALGIGVFRVPILKAVTASYNQTIRVVSSTGTVLNGVASAVSGNYNQTVRIVDSTNHVIDSFGTNCPTIVTNSTLTGNGSGGSPLSVANQPLTWFVLQGVFTTTGGSTTANQVLLNGINIPQAVTFSQLCTPINVADGTNLYDYGLYNTSGALIADWGPQHLVGTPPYYQCYSNVQGTVTIQPGNYLIGWTANSTTGKFFYGGSNTTWYYNATFMASSGGQLPNPLTGGLPTPTIGPIGLGLIMK